MGSLTFPTSPHCTTRQLGTPERAEACRCGDNAIHVEPRDTCLRCGYYSQETIDATWRLRAAVLDAGPAGVLGMLQRVAIMHGRFR